MTYRVKTCFRSLQGEGVRTGRTAVFCRFSGCNLWNGQIRDQKEALCSFCDTDFLGIDGVGGGTFSSAEPLAAHLGNIWRDGVLDDGSPYVVFTGGEPLLQLDDPLVRACHAAGFEVGVETNGTLPCPEGVDWVCVSPKVRAPLVQRSGDELKLVYPQADLDPREFEHLSFRNFSLQPRDGPERRENVKRCVAYCLAHPTWRLSLQVHKLIGIP